MAVGLVIWLVVRILARDTRSPLNPPLRLVRGTTTDPGAIPAGAEVERVVTA